MLPSQRNLWASFYRLFVWSWGCFLFTPRLTFFVCKWLWKETAPLSQGFCKRHSARATFHAVVCSERSAEGRFCPCSPSVPDPITYPTRQSRGSLDRIWFQWLPRPAAFPNPPEAVPVQQRAAPTVHAVTRQAGLTDGDRLGYEINTTRPLKRKTLAANFLPDSYPSTSHLADEFPIWSFPLKNL